MGASLILTLALLAASYRLHPACSVFQAELWAIVTALQHALTITSFGQAITICSDSRSSLATLQKGNPYSYLCNQASIALLQLEENQVQVRGFWVKGHSENPGNDLADELASLADDEEPVFARIPRSIWMNKFRSVISTYALDEDKQIPMDDPIRCLWPTDADRRRMASRFRTDMNGVNQFLTGHGPFRRRFDPLHAMCACGLEEHDARHVLEACPLVTSQRNNLARLLNKPVNYTSFIEFIKSRRGLVKLNNLLLVLLRASSALNSN